ncbi:DUF5916 domain-containing protein [Gillisia limnaea]|uniref:Membrane associated hydrolase n=1 Tax=Gillisia limnaea (strain DSM 15749 / LMG 21470 / R-8282) TaxID=865937 RepID=H2BYF4_GILLR|nr:DUF5916 domain-containing protein [Gillisia limnaea]EHQ03293.1 membrane associated hydrolase [Gillisia limnaea DSM 15749]
MIKSIFTLLLFIFAQQLYSQHREFVVNYISEPIKIDAILDEPAWTTADSADEFWQYFPEDTLQASSQTSIKMLYDNRNLYIGIKVNSIGNKYVVPSLRRDFRAGGSDNITLMFDTFNDGANAFLFGVNPAGVRREALVSGGGTDLSGFTTSWDTKWFAETKIYEGYYISEWIIPLSAFKFSPGETKWRFNSYQFDTQGNEQNTWMRIPRSQHVFNLAFMGDMIFEKPLENGRTPISLIPYINGSTEKDFEFNRNFTGIKAGGDAKFAIGNSLNLDLTINPDFSQVEVDNLVTNLTRFEINLPERRQFFIENSDLFADFGNSKDANPFFSRRIGIAKDRDGINRPNQIIAGARLSGKLNKNFRIGVLNVQNEKDEKYDIEAANNMVVALQHRIFKRSAINAVFVNRQNTTNREGDSIGDDYNRVVGLDYNLANLDNSWNGKFYLHKSFSPGLEDDDFSAGAGLTHNSDNWRIRGSGLFVGENFRSELGFIPRKGILKVDPQVEYLLFPSKGPVNAHTFSVTPIFQWKPEPEFQLSDYIIISSWEIGFKDTSEISANIFNRYTYLFDDFEPTRSGGTPLPANSDYHYTSGQLRYNSDNRQGLSYNVGITYGQFFNGTVLTPNINLNLRLQPRYIISLQARYDKVRLPEPFAINDIWLLGSKVDVTFTKSLFWATFVQYSNQEQNIGINSRIQWRFAPLSDMYLIYNDNYYTNSILAPRYRSLNLKVTYWLYL